MNGTELQQWLGAHGQPVDVDGKPGANTRTAIKAAFVNTRAPAVTSDDIEALAKRLGCTTKQIRAVAIVESGGAGYDDEGRPKLLFERHLFHRLTGGRYSIAGFSNVKGGGYADCSWEKLSLAACRDPDAAFSSVSWGKFQVLGLHWKALGYSSPIDMAYSTVTGEAAHYDMLARFIEANRLNDELSSLSLRPADCRPFARAYNGPEFEKFAYDDKLARAMR